MKLYKSFSAAMKNNSSRIECRYVVVNENEQIDVFAREYRMKYNFEHLFRNYKQYK